MVKKTPKKPKSKESSKSAKSGRSFRSNRKPKNPKKAAKESRNKKKDKKKAKSKKLLEQLDPVLPIPAGSHVSVPSYVELPRWPCDIPAAIHLYYQNRTKMKTDSELALERARARAPATDEKRALRESRIKQMHEKFLKVVAFYMKVPYKTVLDGILDEDEYIDMFEDLLSENGRLLICFTYRTARISDIDALTDEIFSYVKRSIIVTDGFKDEIEDYCVIARRNRCDFAANPLSIYEDYYFNGFSLDDLTNNVVSSLYRIFDNLFASVKVLKSTEWSALGELKGGRRVIRYLMEDLGDFSAFLKSVQDSLDATIKFDYPEELFEEYLKDEEMIVDTAIDNEKIEFVETTAKKWFDVIESIITKCDKIVGEGGEPAPNTSIEHWRFYVSMFASIISFTESPVFVNTIFCLKEAKSYLLPRWIDLEFRLKLSQIKAKDQLKYLSAGQKFWAPISRCGPGTVAKYFPCLFYAFRQIHASSRYLGTPERMASILLKITNSLLTNCIQYLTNDNQRTIWEQKKRRVLHKIEVCLRVHREYHWAYQKTIDDIEDCEDEKVFGCSAVHIFGKIDAFKVRILKIKDYLLKRIKYAVLEQSPMEGLTEHKNRFNKIFDVIPQRRYNVLDHRNNAFNDDYDEFLSQMKAAELSLKKFMYIQLAEMPNIDALLHRLERFEKLKLDCLDYQGAYSNILELFLYEIEELRDTYNFERSKPKLTNFAPSMSGRVMWVRGLASLVKGPMQIIEKKKCLQSAPIAQKVVKYYNGLLTTFIHYEHVFHQEWLKQFNFVEESLAQPVLFFDESDSKYIINFDRRILLTFTEVDCFLRLRLRINELGRMYYKYKAQVVGRYVKIKLLLERYGIIKSTIPTLFVNISLEYMRQAERAFEPCLSLVTWSSLNFNEYIVEIENNLRDVEVFMKEAIDMREARIEDELDRISKTTFIYIYPQNLDHEEYFKRNVYFQMRTSKKLKIMSYNVEVSVIELISKFIEATHSPMIDEYEKWDWLDTDRVTIKSGSQIDLSASRRDSQEIRVRTAPTTTVNFKNDCMDIFNYFHQKFVTNLVRATSRSLQRLRNRTTFSTLSGSKSPILVSNIHLEIPRILERPTLKEMQSVVNKVVTNALLIAQTLTPWGGLGVKLKPALAVTENITEEVVVDINMTTVEFEGNPEYENMEVDFSDSLPNITQMEEEVDSKGMPIITYLKAISSHKEVMRHASALQDVFSVIRTDVEKLLNTYYRFADLWENDKDETINAFAESDPIPPRIREKFEYYREAAEEIVEIPNDVTIGPLEFNQRPLKRALLIECNSWSDALGKKFTQIYHTKLETFMEFIKDHVATLSHEVNDLDDCGVAMDCLEEIRNTYVEMDRELTLFEEMFFVFHQYNIDPVDKDIEVMDSLRYNYKHLLNMAVEKQAVLCSLQKPMKKELLGGINEFKRQIAQYDIDFELEGPMVPGLTAREASDRVLLFQDRFDNLWKKYDIFSAGERLFGMAVTEYPSLLDRKKQFNLLQKLYGLYLVVNKTIDGYYNIVWSRINIEEIMADLTEYQNRCRKLPKGMKDWPAFIDLKKKIDDFNECCPLLEMMTNKAMKDRHWAKLEKLLGIKFNVDDDNFLLRHVMETPLLKYKDDVEDICLSAIKEKDIEFKLKQVIADWALVDLQFSQFKNRGELLLKGVETLEIIAMLEDSLMILNSLATNRFNSFFKKEILQWIQNLATTSEILENWLTVQNLWIYLEAVFCGGDISRQLPTEAKRFSMIDKNWVKIMTRAREIVNVIDVCVGDDTMKSLLPYLLEQLEACQKSLSGYLEQKRLIFPRFFFVSDPALLEILGQASDPHTIQNHLLGCFENIAQVDFSPTEREKIERIVSKEGEGIVLDRPVFCIGGVEYWLGSLLDSAKQSVGLLIRDVWDYVHDPEFRVLTMVAKFPSQMGLLGLQMIWTLKSEKAMSLAKVDARIMRKTNKYFLTILNALIDMTAKNLTKFERVKFETLITIHVHQRDIFEFIFESGVDSPDDFEWLKQERFYYNEDGDYCLVKITDVDFIYQNEFMGCTERLVITPLTDKCYITLAQCVGMYMGGAPAGPAGTGKTETTKDMGKSLGKYVVVFNCSDQMDFRGLGRIFKGLAQSGSWGCFDEFNRIELPVLSVAAQQISIIFTANRELRTTFIFSDGDTVKLNKQFGIFITMNPGYAGRQELPENLKIMFRTIAMMVPDKHIIIRVKLASCGFRDNIALARKFYILYCLCEEQLSKQVHYDFGLRNILSVLRTMGTQKRANNKETEDTVLMRVLRDMNVSKLIDEDEPLFVTLIGDLFIGQKLTVSVYRELQKAIANHCKEAILTNYPPWNLKIIQLYETSLVRHGLMTMGPTGAGKTSCITGLLASLTECGKPHKEMRMNPKAITAPQMFGRLDVATNDWTDGIFSTLWRRSLKIKKTDYVWIVLDGPVDAVWIENLNSVLDDNKTLTLANGDRIVMAANSKLVFEPDNVDNASPATVSRMGMVFLSSSVLPWRPILEAWFRKRKTKEVNILKPLFDKIYGDAFTFVEAKCVAKMKILEALYIRQCIDLLEGLIDEVPQYDEDGELIINEVEMSDKKLENLFLFAVMWSLGAVLELDQRLKLQAFFMEHPSYLHWPELADESETIFEYYVADSGDWIHWNRRVDEYIYPTTEVPEFASILVPNVDNVRTNFLIDTIAKQTKAVLLIGEQGTAKTVMIKTYMSKYEADQHLSKSVNFSSATTPNMVQRIVESYIDKRVGSTYGPPNNRRMTIFIDDINMPDFNSWGDQITNEIVRQLMEQKGFYSLEKPGEFYNIVDIQFMAAMIHPGGGRNDIPPRLKRRFNIFNCTLPSDKSMDKIFSVIGEGYFCEERFKAPIVELVPLLVPLTRIIWQKTKVKMLPTPAKFHYIFNIRDLSRIWEGMLYIQDPELPNITTLLKLWKHESLRVISDRFVNDEDKDWYLKTLVETAKEYLPEHVKPYFNPAETYFVDFMREPPEPTGDEPEDFAFEAPKIYEEMPPFEEVQEKLLSYMESYNEYIRGNPMDLVFFRDAMIHLMKISRVIRTPRGSIMLVGVGGSGKRSLTYLASFIANYSTFMITLTRIYSVQNFMDDLKHLYVVAGAECSGIAFIFTDSDIKDEAFLEFLNNILSSGEVANLFTKEEMDEMLDGMIPLLRKYAPKKIATQDNLYEFFINQARKNLHLVLCFSPVSEKFRSRSLKFPGLISGCTIDWFSKWPKDALIAVANHFISDFPIVCEENVKTRLIHLMGEIQDGVSTICQKYFDRFRRRTYVTPKSFLSFLQGYKSIYSHRHTEIENMTIQMSTGLNKLLEAAESVAILKIELEEKEKEILVASEKTEAVLLEVSIKTEMAEIIKAEVKEVADKAQVMVKEIEKDRQIAETKLEAARPALEAAEAALLTITSADIATVRKLGKPPYLITLIMDAVLILFLKKMPACKPDPERNFFFTNWEGSLKLMTDARFLNYLQNFPKDTINGEIIDLLQPYFNYPNYNYASAKQACGNVAGLLQWTMAMQDFYAVNKEVLPMKANLAVQQYKLGVAQKELAEAIEELKTREEELEVVNRLLNEALKEKKAVQDVADKCQHKMDAATALLSGLSGEQTRWTEQLATFKSETERLVGDVLVLTGFLSYTGPFNQEFRLAMQNNWYSKLIKSKIPVTDNLNIIDNLVDPPTIGEWNLQGLPNDDLSIQNGIIVTKAARYPLLIDPQSQGVVWIKNKERNESLLITSLNHKYFRQHLEDALSQGIPLLIEDVLEELDPVLDNVLEKNFIKIGNSLKVRLSDKEVDVLRSFRMYITTKLANPNYTPEIAARTSIIDFTVTHKGLEDQLLGRVILTEKNELETERTALLTDVTQNKRRMKELEANLLFKLTTVKGSLVDDDTVLQVLNVTKDTASSVRLKLKNAAVTEAKINTAREEFRPVASRGSVLYFLVVEMSMVNYMYQTSLVQFLERFDISLERSEAHQVTNRRILAIIEYLTFEVFRFKSRGLYERHKYLFTLLLALKIDLQLKRITFEDFQNFIKGGGALDLNNVMPKPQYKWLTDTTWLNLVQLSSMPGYHMILDQVIANEKIWKGWFEKPCPEDEVFPEEYEKYDVFKKLLLIRAMCPDRILSQSKKYIAHSLGEKFNSPPLLNLSVMLEETRPLTPTICFLSMGSDPTPMIETTAKRNEIVLGTVSMGQGQEIHARKLMTNQMAEGGWVLLQNCHLALDYMTEIFLLLSERPQTDKNFRLWMTTEPHNNFPINLLQLCVKYTFEPPQGLVAGLMRTYSSITQDFLDFSNDPHYLPLIYSVSFLHTVVQERRKYGPLGWNIPYEFNYSDWNATTIFVQNHLEGLEKGQSVNWVTVRYMLSEVQYGGRVTDDFDKKLLSTFTKVWFNENLMHPDFVFYKGFNVMRHKYLNQYNEAFEELPAADLPQVLGLHPNASITFQANTAENMLQTVISIQPKEAGGVGTESRETVVTRLAAEMLGKMPADYDPFEVKERLQIMGILNPMNIFLRQELDRMQKVVSLVKRTLKDLLLAIEGIIIMNEALRDALDNIYDARVPTLWKRGSWQSSSIGFWFTELLERSVQFNNWTFRGRPMVFWMTGFFNPQGFLTAMRQEITRAHKGWSLETVVVSNRVTKQMKEQIKRAPYEGVLVHGLYLEGAGWDRRADKLSESIMKQLYVQMPVIHIFAINAPAPKDTYICPVYKRTTRTGLNFITALFLPCKMTPEHWIMRGVALLCDVK